MNKLKDDFIKYGLDQYIETFQRFHKDNFAEYEYKLSVLKSLLDKESINNVDRFLQLMLKLPLPSKDFQIRVKSFYNQEELLQIQKEQEYKQNVINRYYEKYSLEGWEKLEVNVFKHHCGLKRLPKDVIKKLKDKLFIDGGAFWGDSMLILSRYNPYKIISFEPNSINFKHLSNTITNNRFTNFVESYQIGLFNKKEETLMSFISDQQNHGASIVFSPYKAQQEKISLDALDNLLEENKKEVGLIKLDVEGVGVNAIKGAKQTIKKYSPVISCAIYHNPEEFFNIAPLISSYNTKYKFLILPLSQDFILKEMTLLAWV
jgi:FkbM family methyltransferase